MAQINMWSEFQKSESIELSVHQRGRSQGAVLDNQADILNQLNNNNDNNASEFFFSSRHPFSLRLRSGSNNDVTW